MGKNKGTLYYYNSRKTKIKVEKSSGKEGISYESHFESDLGIPREKAI